ncbi:hypothetical protein BC826DRAFT_1039276 [Russula brevipes]|nr:hypothetical protein BC826DRAFT_1039276 [Russula brevipes]
MGIIRVSISARMCCAWSLRPYFCFAGTTRTSHGPSFLPPVSVWLSPSYSLMWWSSNHPRRRRSQLAAGIVVGTEHHRSLPRERSVTSARTASAAPICEHVIGLILRVARRATWLPPAPLPPPLGLWDRRNESGMMTGPVVQWDPLRKGRAVSFILGAAGRMIFPPA